MPGEIKHFKCPTCGAEYPVRLGKIKAIYCTKCKTKIIIQ